LTLAVLACFETAQALGFIEPLEPSLLAIDHVIGTLVRLVEPKR
jgi:hypothetical protein